jgi:hypothetical protein
MSLKNVRKEEKKQNKPTTEHTYIYTQQQERIDTYTQG